MLQVAFIRWILYGLRHNPLKLAAVTAAFMLTMWAIAFAVAGAAAVGDAVGDAVSARPSPSVYAPQVYTAPEPAPTPDIPPGWYRMPGDVAKECLRTHEGDMGVWCVKHQYALNELMRQSLIDSINYMRGSGPMTAYWNQLTDEDIDNLLRQ